MVAPLTVNGRLSASIVTVGGGAPVGVSVNRSAATVKLLDAAFWPVTVNRTVWLPVEAKVTLPAVEAE